MLGVGGGGDEPATGEVALPGRGGRGIAGGGDGSEPVEVLFRRLLLEEVELDR